MAILILALSGRALAQAARRAGADVIVADLFGDVDTRALAPWHPLSGSLDRGIDGDELLALACTLGERVEGIVYGAGFEADPTLLGELARIAPLIGNPAEVVATVKDPFSFADLLRRLGLPHPEVAAAPRPGASWLRKRRGGSGGTHIERTTAAMVAADGDRYFQAVAPGEPLSALFAANGRAACVIGLSAQWAAPTPTRPFRYGGCAGPVPVAQKLAAEIERACRAIAAATGLVGLNSLDMLVTGDAFTILEVNPRPGATLDVFDDLSGPSLWECHIKAARGELPTLAAASAACARAARVVYADQACHVPAGFIWDSGVADIPAPEGRISPGAPICTVMAEGPDAGAARALAEERAPMLLARLPPLLQRSA
jgi:predicted ATP-grasp superfamily ATP-dependent carboligase